MTWLRRKAVHDHDHDLTQPMPAVSFVSFVVKLLFDHQGHKGHNGKNQSNYSGLASPAANAGRCNVKALPRPGLLSTLTLPPCASRMLLTRLKPRPLP